MLSLFSVVGLALFAQTITSLPRLPSPDDNTGLPVDLGLDSPNQLSSVGTDPGASFSSLLYGPPSNDAEANLSQQLALNIGNSVSTTPPASQDHANPGCDKAPNSKGKRDPGGGGADTSCPADFTNSSPPGAGAAAPKVPKKIPEEQQQQQQQQQQEGQNSAPPPQGPIINVTPIKPGSRGDLRWAPSADEPVRNPFGEQDKDPQCPAHYKYTVCGIADPRYDTWSSLFTIHDVDLVINSGFGYGMVVRPEWKNRGGIAGWTDAVEECGPDPRAIYCCNEYLPQSRKAYICEPVERARMMEKCWEGLLGLPSQTVLTCIENI